MIYAPLFAYDKREIQTFVCSFLAEMKQLKYILQMAKREEMREEGEAERQTGRGGEGGEREGKREKERGGGREREGKREGGREGKRESVLCHLAAHLSYIEEIDLIRQRRPCLILPLLVSAHSSITSLKTKLYHDYIK